MVHPETEVQLPLASQETVIGIALPVCPVAHRTLKVSPYVVADPSVYK